VSSKGNIDTVRLPANDLRFGIGVAAFGHPPEQAIEHLGECALIEGIPWWTPAQKPSRSRQEVGNATLFTPFLVTCNALASAWAVLDAVSGLSLLGWYERIFDHPRVRSAGAIAVEIVAQLPAGMILDRYMCRSPLAGRSTLSAGQTIVDVTLLDEYFLRNSIRRALPPDTLCTLVMVGIVLDPVIVARTWGEELLHRAFYTVDGRPSDARVIHHTHASVILDSLPASGQLRLSHHSFEKRMDLVAQQLASQPQHVSVVHIESDLRLNQALARIGIIDDVEIVALEY
jgi:hypothetical protein